VMSDLVCVNNIPEGCAWVARSANATNTLIFATPRGITFIISQQKKNRSTNLVFHPFDLSLFTSLVQAFLAKECLVFFEMKTSLGALHRYILFPGSELVSCDTVKSFAAQRKSFAARHGKLKSRGSRFFAERSKNNQLCVTCHF
jgi:hypothetical protein